MPMKRCKADEHYYDEKKYSECPYCRQTIRKEKGPDQRGPADQTDQLDSKPKPPPIENKEPKTRVIPGVYGNKEGVEELQPPVVAWLVIVDGPGVGQDFRVIPGMNRLGRNEDMTIQIDLGDETISRQEHAFLIYDPLNNAFFVKHGSGQNLTYVNGAIVMDAKPLQAHDRIRVGKTELLFVPLCTEQFQWGQDG